MQQLATVHQSRRDWTAAEPLLAERLKIIQRMFGERSPATVPSWHLLSELSRQKGDYARAETESREALDVMRSTPEPDDFLLAGAENQLAMVQLSDGKPARAEPLLRSAHDHLHEAGTHPQGYATSLFNLAGLCASTEREAEARELLAEMTALDDRQLPQLFSLHSARSRLHSLWPLQEGFEASLTLAGRDPSGDAVSAARIYSLVMRRKALAFDLLAASPERLEEKHPEDKEDLRRLALLDRQISMKRAFGAGYEGREVCRRLLDLWLAERDELEESLTQQVSELAIRRRRRSASADDVAAALPSGSVLVELVRHRATDFAKMFAIPLPPMPSRYLAFVVTGGDSANVRLIDLGPAEAIDRLAEQFRQRLSSPDDPGLSALGAELRSAVWDKIEPALGGRERVIIAPDGQLVLVPFDALPANGGHLIDRYAISYVGTGRDVLPSAGTTGTPAEPVVAAGSSLPPAPATGAEAPVEASLGQRLWSGVRRMFGSTKEPAVPAPPLPSILTTTDPQAEAIAVAAALRVRPLAGGEGMKGRLTACRSPRVMHLAARTLLPGAPQQAAASATGATAWGPWESPLRLCGAALTNGSDGLLTAEDVSGMDLAATEVVVLSGGMTAVGAPLGTGLLALRSAFTAAGAGTLVVSLWDVPDGPRRDLFADFYRRLGAGAAPTEALLAARRALKVSHPEPSCWASLVGFTATGAVRS